MIATFLILLMMIGYGYGLMQAPDMAREITAGNVLTIAAYLVTLAAGWTAIKKDIGAVQTWIEEHRENHKILESNVTELQQVTVRLTALQEAMDDRMGRMQSICDRRHNGDPQQPRSGHDRRRENRD